MVRRRVLVHGKVQGVFFRDVCRRRAESLGVAGWVRNLPDGSVEAAFEGDQEAVADLLEWARRGPAEAEVADVEVVGEQPEGLRGFEVRTTPTRLD